MNKLDATRCNIPRILYSQGIYFYTKHEINTRQIIVYLIPNDCQFTKPQNSPPTNADSGRTRDANVTRGDYVALSTRGGGEMDGSDSRPASLPWGGSTSGTSTQPRGKFCVCI